MLLVNPADEVADLPPQDPLQGALLWGHDRHLQVPGSQRSGHFETDEARPHDHGAPAPFRLLDEGPAVRNCTYCERLSLSPTRAYSICQLVVPSILGLKHSRQAWRAAQIGCIR